MRKKGAKGAPTAAQFTDCKEKIMPKILDNW